MERNHFGIADSVREIQRISPTVARWLSELCRRHPTLSQDPLTHDTVRRLVQTAPAHTLKLLASLPTDLVDRLTAHDFHRVQFRLFKRGLGRLSADQLRADHEALLKRARSEGEDDDDAEADFRSAARFYLSLAACLDFAAHGELSSAPAAFRAATPSGQTKPRAPIANDPHGGRWLRLITDKEGA